MKAAASSSRSGLYGFVLHVLAAVLGWVAAGGATAAERGPAPPALGSEAPVQRILVKWKANDRVRALASSSAPTVQALETSRAAALSQRTGIPLRFGFQITPALQLMRFAQPLHGASLQSALVRLKSDPDIEYVEPDYKATIRAIPNDPLFSQQWYLQAAEPAAINAVAAWDVSTSGPGTVIAVLDTGVRFDHPDLGLAKAGGKLLPGYDFIHEDAAGVFDTANDGDGRDADPSDPGDWITAQEAGHGAFAFCAQSESSWHGTQVAGIVGARTNNSAGIAGTSWNAWVLPVRVLGKCGGYNSDILAAIRWSAGLSVVGIASNPYPAQIINLSLGSERTCSSSYQDVIDEVTERGSLVVASAGNASGPVDEPGNCENVLTVAGLRHNGTKVGYSSFGPQVKISAPAGNCVNETGDCLFPIHSTSNSGATAPASHSYTSPSISPTIGTSFSAPQAAAVAGLMHEVNAAISPAGLIARMQASSKAFPHDSTLPTCPTLAPDTLQCNCTTSTCGAGILNATAAVAEGLRPIAAVAPPSNIAAGQPVTLDGSASSAACGRTISTYKWDLVGGGGTFAGATDGASATISAPTSGTLTVRLTVTDNEGRTDTELMQLHANSANFPTASERNSRAACPTPVDPNAPIPTPPQPDTGSGGGGGGGGGAPGLMELSAFAVLAAGRLFARRRRALHTATK